MSPDATLKPALTARTPLTQGQHKKTLRRINTLIEAAARDPFLGIGKPEPLMGNMVGYWSRRIDGAHRLVYVIDAVDLDVIACRGHYDD